MLRLALAVLVAALPLAAQPLKVAVAGMAHAHFGGHLDKMLKGGAVTLAGVADPSPDLRARARKMGVADAVIFADYRDMIERVKPDFVWAFTETNRHLEVVEYCAPRHVHVMVEKPLAATHDEALRIRAAAQKHSIQVFTSYSTAWQPAYYAAKAVLESGRVGDVYRIRTAIGHMGPGDPRKSAFAAWLADPVKNGGGALMDFGCYGVMSSLWFKGRPESVYAVANHLRPEEFPNVEDNATILLQYKDGVAILEASWNLPARPPSGFEIFGRKGSLNILGQRVEVRVNGARPAGQNPAAAEEAPVSPLPPDRAEPLAYMAEHLRSGKPVDGMGALDLNVEIAEILDAAKASVRTGRAVALRAR